MRGKKKRKREKARKITPTIAAAAVLSHSKVRVELEEEEELWSNFVCLSGERKSVKERRGRKLSIVGIFPKP